MDLIPVQSSNIAAVGYDQIQNMLHVQFKGKETVYIYQGVPYEEYEAMMAAPSIGSYYARNIKNRYAGQVADKENQVTEAEKAAHQAIENIGVSTKEVINGIEQFRNAGLVLSDISTKFFDENHD